MLMRENSSQKVLMQAGLIALAIFACSLSSNRIYQVDEAQNIYMMRVLGAHQTAAYFCNPLLWMLGPLAWLAAAADTSATLFFQMRLVFLVVFFGNITLLALATGEDLRSERGLAALLGAATLAPLWDYGFEVRHDNLMLMGLLLMWWMDRVRPRGSVSYFALGLIPVLLAFVTFKSFVFALPLSLAFVFFPPPGHIVGVRNLRLSWASGVGVGALVVALAYGLAGVPPAFLAGVRNGIQISDQGSSFGPWLALSRIPGQAPLVLAFAFGGLIITWQTLRTDGRTALSWGGWIPDAFLCLWAFLVILINPTPYPYNLVTLIPFAYLLAFRSLSTWLDAAPGMKAITIAVVIFTHLVPFGTVTWRHLDFSNGRQELLMQTAERLTDPAMDPVFDGIGMVPLRPAVGYHWYLHSLSFRSFAAGQRPLVSTMLTQQPAPVIIRSYRTDWLPASEQTFIQNRYISLADDFLVLGKVLPSGGGVYQVVRDGHYAVLGLHDGVLIPLQEGWVNGAPLSEDPIRLQVGFLDIRCKGSVQPVVAWVGPTLKMLPKVPQSGHERLFVNWY